MAKTKRKLDSKSFAQQKRHRRQWVTFMRMCRYGINNFSRNAWLTVAATAIMTITLLVIFTSVVARNVLIDTVDQLRDRVDMSIYVDKDIDSEAIEKITAELRQLPSVQNVSYITPSQARESYIDDFKTSPEALEAVTESTNEFPGTFSVKIKDINNTAELQKFTKENETFLANADKKRAASFAGERRATIQRIGEAANFALQAGVITSIVFGTISMLIIFNTIRMAIFNRREEIQMMKLIGAERSFIRGPFLVEAIVYGFFAAIIASVIGYVFMFVVGPSLGDYLNIDPVLELLTIYAGFVLLAMISVGALIGIISSLLATQRYLKL